MATYLTLNLIIFILVFFMFKIPFKRPSKAWLIALVGLMLLTLVFDNLLIFLDMYSYAPSKILGVYIWLAPIEDFMYPLLAMILVPFIWHKLGKRYASE